MPVIFLFNLKVKIFGGIMSLEHGSTTFLKGVWFFFSQSDAQAKVCDNVCKLRCWLRIVFYSSSWLYVLLSLWSDIWNFILHDDTSDCAKNFTSILCWIVHLICEMHAEGLFHNTLHLKFISIINIGKMSRIKMIISALNVGGSSSATQHARTDNKFL